MSRSDDSDVRRVLKLGEADIIDLRVSREVLDDADWIVRKRLPASLPLLVVLIDACNIATTLDPNQDTIAACVEMTGYLPDARVLAAAVDCDCDLFVTFDFEHFLQNPLIGPPNTRLKVVDAYQALEWIARFIDNETV